MKTVEEKTLLVIYGNQSNPIAIKSLENELGRLNITGTLYIGYPIMALADESVTVDALLISDEGKLVAFHIPQQEIKPNSNEFSSKLKAAQDNLYNAVESNLVRHSGLKDGRKLAVLINVITYIPTIREKPDDKDVWVASERSLEDVISKCEITNRAYLPALNAAIQRLTTMKPKKKRDNIKKDNSKGAILKKIEKEIANLDQWQKQAAIETAPGPQRIRGLAGSGKTIVLALKAAYLHCQNPHWNISRYLSYEVSISAVQRLNTPFHIRTSK
ncbi:hypothetical protein MCHI_003097 [Candidatus Magnetoovum chiemensis]|nr:hypothetical protein MCHI_003097 [Candidatus Magnetoovum chiemensis]